MYICFLVVILSNSVYKVNNYYHLKSIPIQAQFAQSYCMLLLCSHHMMVHTSAHFYGTYINSLHMDSWMKPFIYIR